MDSCRNSIKAMFDQVYSFRYMFMVASFVCVVVHLLDLSAFSCYAGGNIDADRLLWCVYAPFCRDISMSDSKM